MLNQPLKTVLFEVASKYPERPEMRYMSYEMATGLMGMNGTKKRVELSRLKKLK
jgi:hypothetical protein